MSVYVISDVDVRDPEGFAAYVAAVPAVLAAHDVEYVVRGGSPEPLEGSWAAERMVVLRFRDREHVRRWYESPEYQELIALRGGAAEVSAIVVDGYDHIPDRSERER